MFVVPHELLLYVTERLASVVRLRNIDMLYCKYYEQAQTKEAAAPWLVDIVRSTVDGVIYSYTDIEVQNRRDVRVTTRASDRQVLQTTLPVKFQPAALPLVLHPAQTSYPGRRDASIGTGK